MAVVFALEKLFDDVVARFTAESTAVTNLFGWREPARHKTVASRIVWVPGRAGDGDAGAILPPREPGRNPRPLLSHGELFHVRISGFDATEPEDERKQYAATMLVFHAWARAVYLAARGTISFRAINWNTSKLERRHATELVCLVELRGMIPDVEQAIAPVDTTAAIDTSLEDVTETTVAAPDP